MCGPHAGALHLQDRTARPSRTIRMPTLSLLMFTLGVCDGMRGDWVKRVWERTNMDVNSDPSSYPSSPF